MRTVICTSVISVYDDGKMFLQNEVIVTGTASQDNVKQDLALTIKTMETQLSNEGRLQSMTQIR